MSSYKKVLILGSSALKIGEAGEFDYSGSQAIKALKEEGIETIVVNPNIATIQTSEYLADTVYFLPVTCEFVEEVIKKERPDGLLLSFGGQTALNCGLQLQERGILERHGVEVLGTPVSTIRDTEDRDRFVQRLNEVDALSATSRAVGTVDEALSFAHKLGYPVMIRLAFTLGGLGSGVCHSAEELEEAAIKALTLSPQFLVEEYLGGWKEIEYEVVRDRYNNCITVCNMENLDPMGIHTGESIVVAPSQTLSNRDYHLLREVSIRVIRHLGIVGECNIQFAYDPHSEDYRIIEVNARLSRSSALASKATGYPLAFIAAKLALGYGLHELKNAITKVTTAMFEPALDYVVVKVPRWDLKKFRKVSKVIGSGMKSVGEVMAIGRSFEEALQKALRMLETGAAGLVATGLDPVEGDIRSAIQQPTEDRIYAVAEAMQRGLSIDEIHDLSRIDRWFLQRIHRIVALGKTLESAQNLDRDLLLTAKGAGFSDLQIARLRQTREAKVRARRFALNIHPVVRQIDTLAAEYPAKTNYLYLSYHGIQDDIAFPETNTVMIIGSGAYRIGSSVEFDWCCVTSGLTLKALGYHTVMLNYNPETVSTDFDVCDKLFFDEISLETVLELNFKLSPMGVMISVGGQLPNNLAMKLHHHGVPVLGTSPRNIDRAENRHHFSTLLDSLNIDQPEWSELATMAEAEKFAARVGFPVLVRPSYVLSGAAMAVASNSSELAQYLAAATAISKEYPVVMSKFLEDAKEIEFDAVASHGKVLSYAISEHIENAGVHSGDATLVTPPQRTYLETIRKIRKIAGQIAAALEIHGPFNIQFIAKSNRVRVIECNLRASRSFPFVSKVLKHNFIEEATRVMVDSPVTPLRDSLFDYDYVGVKAPQFSFTRLAGADPTTGVEMSSTGEVGCIGDSFNEAFLKALVSVGYDLNIKTILLSSGNAQSKLELLESTRLLMGVGIQFYATPGTAAFLAQHGIEVETLNWPMDEKEPNIKTYLKEGRIDLVINIPKDFGQEELTNDYMIRRIAVDYSIPLITNRQVAQRLAEALAELGMGDLKIAPWQDYQAPNRD